VDDAPDPANGGTDESLLKIAAHQLEQKAAPFYQITEKQGSRDGHFVL
jgi:heat shock protein HspQ